MPLAYLPHLRLNCRLDGPEGGPVLVLTHALGTNLTIWDHIIPLLPPSCELQGITSSLNALAMILAPLVMTWIFGIFTAPDAPVLLPGAPFLLSAALMVVGVLIFVASPREKAAA